MRKNKTISSETVKRVSNRYSGRKNTKIRGKKPVEKPSDFKGALKRLFVEVTQYRLLMVVVLIAGIIATALSTIGPNLLGDVVDAVNEQVKAKLSGGDIDMGVIGKTLLIIFGVYMGSSLFSYIQQYIMCGITQKVTCSLREKINKKISILPFSYLDSSSKGDLLSRMMNDVDNISKTLQNNVIQIITSLVSFFGILAIMLWKSWKLTLLSIAILPPAGVVAFILLGRSKKYFRAQWDTTGIVNAHIEEMFTGHKIVKVFNHEATATEEFNEVNNKLFEESRKAQFVSGILMPFINFISNIGYVVICIAGGFYVLRGEMTVGAITSFIAYSKLFVQPVIDLSNISNRLQSSLASAERVFDTIDAEPETPDDDSGEISSDPSGVEFDNVCFRYIEDTPVIEDFSLKVSKGQLIAIVGPTGAGKTTIVNLLMRFYDVDSGSIKIDGTDIRTVPREKLRSIFGMVLQDTWLFNGTIRDNIAYGRENATEEEIIEAAKAARAHHFIQTLSEGYDTVLSEDGTNISLGQRQLLTIARSILADPAILILDEATSSVDTRTEIQIQKAMNTLMKGRTNFVIAHRLSTIVNADMILVLNEGRIVETGTHKELMEAGGFYCGLYNSQFKGNEI